MNDKLKTYIEAHKKSKTVGFILALIFGPLGLFYASWVAGLILSVVALFTLVTILVPIACWIVSMALSFYFVSRYNDKVIATANLNSPI